MDTSKCNIPCLEFDQEYTSLSEFEQYHPLNIILFTEDEDLNGKKDKDIPYYEYFIFCNN